MSVSFYGVNVKTEAFSEAEVNLSNINASGLLDLLGIQVGEAFEERCAGEISPDDLLGRVLLAQALSPADEGLPSYKLTGTEEEAEGQTGLMADLIRGKARALANGEESATIYSAGRSAGYYDQKLSQVRELAEQVKALGKDWVINWA